MPDATLFPDTRGPRAGVRRAVDARNRARGGAARSVDAVASRVAVARAVASPRVPGFAFVRGWEGARTRERRLHRHLGGRLGGEERAASGDGALARRGATHARGGDAAASARHREAGHGHAERGGHRRRPVRMEWPACARSGTKTPKPRARDEARHVARWCRSRIGFDTSKALFFFFFFPRRSPSHGSFSLVSFASHDSPIPPLSRKIRVRPRVQWETVSIARREAFVCSRWRSRK